MSRLPIATAAHSHWMEGCAGNDSFYDRSTIHRSFVTANCESGEQRFLQRYIVSDCESIFLKNC